ncbi:MAG TPA: ABC transporter permease [Tepidisphaeraceae bacterium]|jgi:lipopolysaccharide transport system permease protein|nr:ABC transporter permease [Tepidisphaeraceae bacterium]
MAGRRSNLSVPLSRISGEAERFWPMMSPVRMLRVLWGNGRILFHLSMRSMEAGHRGSMLGRLWLVMDPLLLLAVYGFVFGVIFGGKGGGGRLAFVFFMYTGILTYGVFSQAANIATGLIRGSTGYVKQMVFPLEVIPVSAVGAMVIPTLIGLGLLVVGNGFWGSGWSWTEWLAPLAMLPIILLALGSSFALSALGVFVPDLAKITHVVTQMLFFLTPVVWDVSRLTIHLPKSWRWLPWLSPLTVGVEAVRSVVLNKELPAMWPWVGATVACAVVCQVGFAIFMQSRRAFADVL